LVGKLVQERNCNMKRNNNNNNNNNTHVRERESASPSFIAYQTTKYFLIIFL
jgi:hypothetical protein